MSSYIKLDGDSMITVRTVVYDSETDEPISNTNAIEYKLSEILAIAAAGGAIPAATTTVAGVVKQGAAVPVQAAVTVAGADVAALVTSTNTALATLVAKINAITAALRTAGIIVT